jgi:protein tyrosine phosphatase (PTP) superfamily phosphohydrolase (DUF442 family)
MSNDRLKQFKERIKTDPEYKQHLKNRHKERMQTDPKYKARMQAKGIRKTSKRKARLLTTPERCERHQQFKLNQFKKSIMNEVQLKELRRQQKQASYDKFAETHGINYHTYNRWSNISGLKNVQAVIEYRDKQRPVITHCNRGERFKAKYGVTIWEWNKVYKPLGYTLESLLERKYQLERKRAELESLKSKPIIKTDEPQRQRKRHGISFVELNKKYLETVGIGYATLNAYKHRYGFDTIEQTLEWYKQKTTMASNCHSKFAKNKQQAYTQMQNKICDLERLITIPEIRDNKINQLKAEFNNIYGAI